MFKRFKDFVLRNILKSTDYIVGYDGLTGEEIRIEASKMLQKGDSGDSAQIQFSVNAADWHFPAVEEDIYIRFRVGIGQWSVSRFVGIDGENGTPGAVVQFSANNIDWSYTPSDDDVYVRFELVDGNFSPGIKVIGRDGKDGVDATIEIGSVTTGDPDTDASVENVGTPQAAKFNFIIPRGNSGVDGKGITDTTVTYRVSNSGTAIPTGSWSENIPETSPGQYLWTRVIITYSDNTAVPFYSVSRNGRDGEAGGAAEGAVSYVESQDLDDEQKRQARENISAFSADAKNIPDFNSPEFVIVSDGEQISKMNIHEFREYLNNI